MRVMNLGLGGCFVLVHSGHAVDETFEMQIDLGDQGLLDVSATTLYHTINGSAVTFLNLSQHSYDQIQRTVGATFPPSHDCGGRGMDAKDWRFPMACPACKAMSGKPHRAHTNTDELVIEMRCSNCRHEWELSAPPPAVFLIRKQDRRSESAS